MTDTTADTRTNAQRAASDPHRPVYHFLPEANWLNDPNGLIWWRGWHHMFYQYNPGGAVSADKHWAHARSRDLVHWEHLPIALAPVPGSQDQDGVYSGAAVVHDGVPTLVYTGVLGRTQLPCLATPLDDDLIAWRRDPANPVIAAPPAGLNPVGFRDHTLWREADGWHMLIGAGVGEVGGQVPHYRSADLRRWEYLGPLLTGDQNEREPLWTGEMWECPDFFPVGDRHVLVISVWHRRLNNPYDGRNTLYPAVFVGRYAGGRFTPERLERIDAGWSFYAPQSYRDDRDRRVMFGWLKEHRPVEAQVAAGWSGAMSLPRVVTLRPDGGLGWAPAPEVETLRGTGRRAEFKPAVGLTPVEIASEDTVEIIARLAPGGADRVGLALRRTPDGAEETLVLYDRRAGQLVLDTSKASLDATTRREVDTLPFVLGDGEDLELRVFVDRSVVEVFANGRLCATARVYPTRPDADGVAIVAEGGPAGRCAVEAWPLRSIWPDR